MTVVLNEDRERVTQQLGRSEVETLTRLLDERTAAWESIWYCGSTGFAHVLRCDVSGAGLCVDRDFHLEFFDMR